MEPDAEQRLERVPGSRRLPWAVLAAIVVLLGVLVTEPWAGPPDPRPTPAPAASPARDVGAAARPAPTLLPSPRPATAASPAPRAVPLEPMVLSVRQFAAALVSSEFIGSAMLVEGRIVDEPGRGRWSCHGRAYLCPYGLLQGVESGGARRPLIVQARHLARPLTAEQPNAGRPEGWQWQPPPTLPVEGVLALRIHGRYSIEYLGQPLPPRGGGFVWPAAALAGLDRASIGPGSVLLGRGWLDVRDRGLRACEHSEWDGSLPDLRCGADAWLVSAEHGRHTGGQRQAMLQLQPDAQRDVANRPPPGDSETGPLESVFVLAPRLWSGCHDSADCWRWQALGLLAPNAALAAVTAGAAWPIALVIETEYHLARHDDARPSRTSLPGRPGAIRPPPDRATQVGGRADRQPGRPLHRRRPAG